MNKNNNEVQFNKGIMKLSAYDPLLNQYETRILALPELPILESLEHLFNTKPLTRQIKSCHNKRFVDMSDTNDSAAISPRRCQSNPNFSNKKQEYQKKNNIGKYKFDTRLRSKRSLTSAFQAVADFFTQRAHKKSRSQRSTQVCLSDGMMVEISSDSNISTLDLYSPSQRIPLSTVCENWWSQSPPINSF